MDKNNINDYITFTHLGGDNNNFSEEAYKKLQENIIKHKDTKVFLNWRNDLGRDCKNIGVATRCFCNHTYKVHNYLNPKNNQVNCKEKKCPCINYNYVPVHGSYDFKCLCKHSFRSHHPFTKQCKDCNCKKFKSTWSCSCGLKFGEHVTVAETRAERIKNGKPVSEIEKMLLDPMIFGENIQNNNQLDKGFKKDISKYVPDNPNNFNNFNDILDKKERFPAIKNNSNKLQKSNVLAYDLFMKPHKYIK